MPNIFILLHPRDILFQWKLETQAEEKNLNKKNIRPKSLNKNGKKKKKEKKAKKNGEEEKKGGNKKVKGNSFWKRIHSPFTYATTIKAHAHSNFRRSRIYINIYTNI